MRPGDGAAISSKEELTCDAVGGAAAAGDDMVVGRTNESEERTILEYAADFVLSVGIEGGWSSTKHASKADQHALGAHDLPSVAQRQLSSKRIEKRGPTKFEAWGTGMSVPYESRSRTFSKGRS